MLKEKITKNNHFNYLKKDESGSTIVLVVLLMTVLLMFAALSVDCGMYYVKAEKLQNACDEATLASAAVYDPADSSTEDEAIEKAKTYMKANGFEIVNEDVTFYPEEASVEITKKIDIETTFAKIMNINSMVAEKTAKATAIPAAGTSGDEYSLFSASNSIPISIKGSLHVSSPKNVHTNSNIKTIGYSSFAADKALVTSLKENESDGARQFDTLPGKEQTVDEEIEVPDYHDAIMERLPKNYNGKIYETLDEYFEEKNITEPFILNEKIVVKKLSNSGFTKNLELSYNASLKIIGDGTNNQNDIFKGTVTLKNGASIYSECGSIEFNNLTEVYAAYIVAKNDIRFTSATWGLLGRNNFSTAALYAQNGDIEIRASSDTFYGLIYAPHGEFNINNFSIKVLGNVIVNSLSLYDKSNPSSLGGGLTIDESQATDNSDFKPKSSPSDGGKSKVGRVRLVK